MGEQGTRRDEWPGTAGGELAKQTNVIVAEVEMFCFWWELK